MGTRNIQQVHVVNGGAGGSGRAFISSCTELGLLGGGSQAQLSEGVLVAGKVEHTVQLRERR